MGAGMAVCQQCSPRGMQCELRTVCKHCSTKTLLINTLVKLFRHCGLLQSDWHYLILEYAPCSTRYHVDGRFKFQSSSASCMYVYAYVNWGIICAQCGGIYWSMQITNPVLEYRMNFCSLKLASKHTCYTQLLNAQLCTCVPVKCK